MVTLRFILLSLVMATLTQLIYTKRAMANIDYLPNQSANYLMNPIRIGSTEGADIANFNPAGTAFMKDGIHFDVSVQSITVSYSGMEYKGKTYGSNEPVPAIPNAYFVFKKGRWSLFASFTIPAGGGTRHYKDGIPMLDENCPKVSDQAQDIIFEQAHKGLAEKAHMSVTEYWLAPTIRSIIGSDFFNPNDPSIDFNSMKYVEQHLDFSNTKVDWLGGEVKGSSMYLAGTIGTAYQIIEKVFATSFSIRYIYAKNEYSGWTKYRITPVAVSDGCMVADQIADEVNNPANITTELVELDASKEAHGIGAIIGLHWRPVESLNIGLRYESQTVLSWKESVKDGKSFAGMFVDGRRRSYNLPSLVGLGIEWSPTGWLAVGIQGHYYFVKLADSYSDEGGEILGYNDNYSDAWDGQFGLKLKPFDWLEFGAGTAYYYGGANKKTYSDLDAQIPCVSISGGIKITPFKCLSLTGSGGYLHYFPKRNAAGNKRYIQKNIAFAVGVEYRYLFDTSDSRNEVNLPK